MLCFFLLFLSFFLCMCVSTPSIQMRMRWFDCNNERYIWRSIRMSWEYTLFLIILVLVRDRTASRGNYSSTNGTLFFSNHIHRPYSLNYSLNSFYEEKEEEEEEGREKGSIRCNSQQLDNNKSLSLSVCSVWFDLSSMVACLSSIQ
jgi:hypothetical protein